MTVETRIWTPGDVGAAAEAIREGALVAFPTETVYGLGGDGASDAAVAAIYAAKGRPTFNPLILHVPDIETADALVALPPNAVKLAEAFWPGPLTIVAPKRAGAGISALATAGLPTAAIRVPARPVAQRLLELVGRPVAAPSANPSGRISPTSAAHVLAGLGGRIAGVLDGGPCDVGVESAIVGFRGERPVLLRPGGAPAEALEAVLGEKLEAPAGGAIAAPGMLASHYAPRAAVRLGADGARAGETYIAFGAEGEHAFDLSRSGDLEEAAANLFSMLHEADAIGEPIAVAPIPERGLGRAINDRLRRAAAPRGDKEADE